MATELKLEDILTGPYTWKALQPCDLSNCTKEQILDYFENSYSLNESIFAALSTEDGFYKPPDRLRLPLIFYYAHTAGVYINKLMLAGLLEERVNLEFETMFETGVDEMSWDDTENYRMGGSFKWPDLKDVREYRQTVRNVIRKVIEDTPLELPINQDSPWWAVFMGIEHEHIHIETSSVLIRQLPIAMVTRPDGWLPAPLTCGESPLKNPMIKVEESNVTMGKPWDFPSYGWDNEYPQLNASVPSFEASKYLITNQEFLHFIKAGGYKKEEFWSKEGWRWRTYRQASHPTFWVCNEGCKSGCGGALKGYSHCGPDQNDNQVSQDNTPYRYRALCEETVMPWDWPAEVNYHEAKAFAKWKGPGYRLLTEAEHHSIRDHRTVNSLDARSDLIFQDDVEQKYNVNLAYGTSTPVNMYPANKRGFHDVFGNVWCWVEDHFNGLPGSKTHFLYDDFSSPTYDGKHNILLGGSWISTGDEASVFARYAFRRHFFQHAGFRLARSVSPDSDVTVRLVETCNEEELEIALPIKDLSKKLVHTTNSQLLTEQQSILDDRLFDEFSIGDLCLTSALAKVVSAAVKKYGAGTSQALDMGCGCGKTTFELSRQFDEVIGIDFCGVFIKAAKELLAKKQKIFSCPKDGCQRPSKRVKKNCHDGCAITASIPEDTDASRITFKQFTWVPNELMGFDLVLHHFLDRVLNKKAWLVRLWEILNPGGIVVISGIDGWTREKLEPIIGERLEFLESMSLRYTDDYSAQEPDSKTTVSVWCRKTKTKTNSATSNGHIGSQANSATSNGHIRSQANSSTSNGHIGSQANSATSNGHIGSQANPATSNGHIRSQTNGHQH